MFLGWIHISEKKLLKTAILLVQELRIYKKKLFLGPGLALILSIFGASRKSKLYKLKKVGLSTFKEIL